MKTYRMLVKSYKFLQIFNQNIKTPAIDDMSLNHEIMLPTAEKL